ncbi:MAG TPA: hypothetical protein VM033_01750 [Gemmatimonadaceae bacterium]|nr:hypothetical protein [Gemmatimonadaceae bacterium]
MTDAELWSAWRMWMALAAAIIVVAAVLLIMIWRTARGIYAEALRALVAAEQIRASTNPIWALETTNDVAGTMLETVQRIEQKGGALAAALESHAGAR